MSEAFQRFREMCERQAGAEFDALMRQTGTPAHPITSPLRKMFVAGYAAGFAKAARLHGDLFLEKIG